jgi:hypothetical protein
MCSYVGRFATYEACEKELARQEDFRCFNEWEHHQGNAAKQKAWTDSLASKRSNVEPHLQEALELVFSSGFENAFFLDVRNCVVEIWRAHYGATPHLVRKIYLNTLDRRHANVEYQDSLYWLHAPGSSTAVERFDAKGALIEKSKDLSQPIGDGSSTRHELQRKANAFNYLYSKQCKGTARPF